MMPIYLRAMDPLYAATANLLTGRLTALALAPIRLVDDRSSRHVTLSNPGVHNGSREQWEGIVIDPRHRVQQFRQSLPTAGQTTTRTVGLPQVPEGKRYDSNISEVIANLNKQQFKRSPLHADCVASPALPTANLAVGRGSARCSLSMTSQSCNLSDYVVSPVNAAGSSTHANRQHKSLCTQRAFDHACFTSVGARYIPRSHSRALPV